MNTTHIDTAGYALHAVDELERARAEKHLRDCGQCREEVAEMQEITAMLAMDPPEVTPSAGLRANLLDQIQVTPQESAAPVAAATRPASTGRSRRAVL
ncbi:MAG: anti-sigma factor, partial [Allobranchiibius sp.]